MKALEILKKALSFQAIETTQICEAISELEALQQPKSCSTCKHSFYWKEIDRLECTKLDKPYCFNCEEELSMVEVTGDFFLQQIQSKGAMR